MSNFNYFNNNNNNSTNNNNYIPSFYGDIAPPTQQHLIENATQMRSFGSPHNFTFTYPTQGNTVSTPRSSIQATNSMGFLSAPGLGTTWQHSYPATLTTSGNGGFTSPIFTGMPARSEPQPSCSSPMKRPKRKAMEDSEDAPSFKVYLCTDQFANLHINHDWSKVMDNHEKHTSLGATDKVKDHDPNGWSRFQKVENSIECDVDEDEENTKPKEKGVLHINEAIINTTKSTTTDSILPRDVLNQIAQPCMQVVLWKSPGEMVRDVIKVDISAPKTPISSPSRVSPSSSKSYKFTLPSNGDSTSGSVSRLTTATPCNSSSFQQSPDQVVPLSSSSSHRDWNWSASPGSHHSSNASSSRELVEWDNNLDLDVAGCDEEMQL